MFTKLFLTLMSLLLIESASAETYRSDYNRRAVPLTRSGGSTTYARPEVRSTGVGGVRSGEMSEARASMSWRQCRRERRGLFRVPLTRSGGSESQGWIRRCKARW